MDYILQNMQYRYMENVIQQINRGAVQNVTTPSPVRDWICTHFSTDADGGKRDQRRRFGCDF